MRRTVLATLLAAATAAALLPQASLAVTDDDVLKAIERGKEYLIRVQGSDGSWPEVRHMGANECGHTEMALFTLVALGVHPNRDTVAKGLDVVLARPLDFNYAICFRTMALARLQNRFTDARRESIRAALKADVLRLVNAQLPVGGWTYSVTPIPGLAPYDLSNTQMAILALREAALAGVEIAPGVWKKTQDLYCRTQLADGSWDYSERLSDGFYDAATGKIQAGKGLLEPKGYGSMTAAGLATLFITSDYLEAGRGCPCKGGQSSRSASEIDRRMDTALEWMEANFRAEGNPNWRNADQLKFFPYWLYCVERVGSAVGYKYFGHHNWYKEGAELILKWQRPDGSWINGYGAIPDTCFCLLFLYKARAPVLFNKLQYKGDWNLHRCDIANLTAYSERAKEQPFHWQIVTLQAPREELHDAPVLYITAETPPTFTEAEKAKLRTFTDTGGTILFEASCGNAAVRRWFALLAKELWPEWPLKQLPPDHPTFADPYALRLKPEMSGIHDGLRTLVFYAHDDVSCPWNTKAYAAKEYLFQWGINLFTYATDHAALRAKLAAWEPATSDRYPSAVAKGAKDTVRVARLKYQGGPWAVGRQYRAFQNLAGVLAAKARITLKAEEDGVSPSQLGDREAAYLTGTGAVVLAEPERQALKEYLAKGGFLWAEAAGGAPAFDEAFQKLASDMGWELARLPADHPLMTGKFRAGAGYNVVKGVRFRHALQMRRTSSPFAELLGIRQDGKLVGVYSPLDVLFSTTGYEAYGCLGYQAPDAVAVATNIGIYLTDRPEGE